MATKKYNLGKHLSMKTYIRRVGKRAVCCVCGQKIEWKETDIRLLLYAKGRKNDRVGASFCLACMRETTDKINEVIDELASELCEESYV